MSKSIEQFPKDLSSPLIQIKSSVEKNSKLHIKELFALEPERFHNYSVKFDQLFFDYSKQRVTKNILEQLVALAKNKQLTQWINRLFRKIKLIVLSSVKQCIGLCVYPRNIRNFRSSQNRSIPNYNVCTLWLKKSMLGNIVALRVK